MDFCDKLRELLDDKNIAVDVLSKKINVTSETINMWLDGSAKPSDSQLDNLATVLEVTKDEITFYSSFIDVDDIKPRKWLLYIILFILFGIIIFFLNKAVAVRNNNNGIIDTLLHGSNAIVKEATASEFNKSFLSGDNNGINISSMLDQVVIINKEGNHKVTVKYEEDNITIENIDEIKNKLTKWETFNVALGKDENGYVNNILITIPNYTKPPEEVKEEEITYTDFDIDSFNTYFKMYEGNQSGFSIFNLIDIVKENNSKESRLVYIRYSSLYTSTSSGLDQISSMIEGYLYYDVSFVYDEYGFIQSIKIL